MATNYFGPGVDAKRYSRARPRVHAAAIERFKRFARVESPFGRGLDVACGTGRSAVALAAVADSVVGVDSSAEMLSEAEPHPRVTYYQAPAEHIPFPDGEFDVVTAALAFHWFDPQAFLAESHRLLRASGWLVIYSVRFTGEMAENAGFAPWFRDAFLYRFPRPPRGSVVPTADLAEAHGFVLRGEEAFVSDVEMSVGAFIDYELSTSNLIAATRQGSTSETQAASWLRESVAPFFGGNDERTFRFAGTIWYLVKNRSRQ